MMTKSRLILIIKQFFFFIFLTAIAVFLSRLIYLSYAQWGNITGFGEYIDSKGEIHNPKTFWDWMELIIVPMIVAFVIFVLEKQARANERRISDERAKVDKEIAAKKAVEDAFQAYLDKIKELLLDYDLKKAIDRAEVRDLSRANTLTSLLRLDEKYKGLLLNFLCESKLIQASIPIINLDGADFSGAELTNAKLGQINLESTIFVSANFIDTFLGQTNLQGANLSNANLRGANLSGANLRGANFEGAILEHAILSQANLEYANLMNAKLYKANLSYANLDYADFSGADLEGVALQGVRLINAKFKGAIISERELFFAGSYTMDQFL